ncbi:hypothetical protein KP509_36G065800 [Ceratopteris richardii]|uniref:Uncharacterized protein n=1 Tax=Ceratopteris richardii TaxID=49495 RepID=A0A8T2QDR6_CERRI|nr:hypothetical protein KP509_36G065800 [Ceratopteris richardii]
MVLSNKKLKQKLRAEAARKLNPALTQLKSQAIKKRQKRQLLRGEPTNIAAELPQPTDDTPVIDEAELDIYNRCIDNLVRERDSSPSSGQVFENEIPVPRHSPGQEDHETRINQRISGDKEDNPSNVENSTLKFNSKKRKKAVDVDKRTERDDRKAADNHAEDQEDSTESRTVYVGGIPYYSSEDDIRSFFSDCGTISEVNLKTFRDSGKFCGIALLTFKTSGAAQRALALDGSNMGDRFLKIQPSAAKPKETPKKEVHIDPPKKTQGYLRAYIGNLSWSVTEEDIRNFFKGCRIENVRFSEDKVTGDFRGFGHVDFADDESLELALKQNQEILLERPMKVAYAVPNTSQKKLPPAIKDMKDVSCHTCGEKGHISSKCPYMGRG